MRCRIFRRCICLLLILSLAGCRTAYELDFSSKPSGAAVSIGGRIYGTTPCTIEISRDSEEIDDHLVEITYSLPDGRTVTEEYDLREYEKVNSVSQFVGGALMISGVLLVSLVVSDDEDNEEDYYTTSDDDGDERYKWQAGLIGLGLVGAGLLVHGPDDENNDIHIIFKDAAQ